MSKTRTGTSYLLTFWPEPDRPDGPNAAQRLRMLLKHAKRSLGLICTGIAQDLPAELPPPDLSLDVERSEPPFAAEDDAMGG